MSTPSARGWKTRGARLFLLSLAAPAALALAACGGNHGRVAANPRATQTGAIGVNGWLWRATLDTLAFMPLHSADPFGGVVITDWYQNPEKPDERFKATVYILDSRLRADGLNVTVFKEVSAGGGWVTAPTSPQTAADIENAILTKARQLRLSNLKS
ncbi:MAG: DUF3576 domain-containing protein [Caulobacteraceae bacterium]